VKTQGDFTTVLRNVTGPEKIIPEAEADGKIDPHFSGRNCFCVVIQMHYWIIKEVFEDAPSQFDIGMIEVAYGDGHKMYDEGLLRLKTT